MKKQILPAPILMIAALASMVASGVSCGRNPSVNGKTTVGTNVAGAGKNAVDTNANWTTPSTAPDTNNVESSANASGSLPGSANSTGGMNSTPPALPATPEPAPTAPDIRVVEMPATTPEPPKQFYANDIATNHGGAFAGNENYFFRLRAGYEHIYHGDNNDTWYAGLKFYAYPDNLRECAGKNAWLIPDADLEFSHQDLAKPDIKGKPGSAPGLNLRASFLWPWVHWTTSALVREHCLCPYAQPLTFTLGPTANFGFDYLFEDNDSRLARYFGARLSINRQAFLEYTVGATDGLEATRQQALAEIPFYITRDQQVRYVFRGLWNHGNTTPDVLEAGLFLEMPLGLLAHPGEWSDLIPFVN